MAPRRINEIVHGTRAITADTALRLARYFGTSERFWMNLQGRYDLEVEKDRHSSPPTQPGVPSVTLDLPQLATAIRDLNMAATRVSTILGRPALPGHVGEAIAAVVFDIELTDSATTPGHDGHFRSGPLAGMSVNIKFYPRHQRVLDINPEALPSYFLVLAGPTAPATSSRGQDRPWVIDRVFLFDDSGDRGPGAKPRSACGGRDERAKGRMGSGRGLW